MDKANGQFYGQCPLTSPFNLVHLPLSMSLVHFVVVHQAFFLIWSIVETESTKPRKESSPMTNIHN